MRPRCKVLLEIMVSHPELRVVERPFTFGARHAGESKASTLQGIEFARQLVALRLKPAGRSKWVYDVHGLVGVESDRALPELERFLVRSAPMAPSISVRVVAHGGHAPGRVRQPHARCPHRQLSGTNWLRNVTERGAEIVEVTVSPLVARSPHVLYTNVVEPILRWRLVELGYALVHAACFADGEDAFLVTARTDTGKTTTMLKVLDGSELRFISDDLVILSPDGVVRSYPKPLTISAHTVHALTNTMLTRRERLVLRPQSRIHSREGRRLAFLLTRYRLPVASINALIQRVIPPPKYHVQRLVRGVVSASSANVAGLFVIQRGGTGEQHLGPEDSLSMLLSNCDDAFGFPPYASLERLLLAVAEGDLRTAEREIIASRARRVQARLLRSETLDWANRIPGVVATWREADVNDRAASGIRS